MNKGRILIVDDEGVVRNSLTEWFSEEGYSTKGVPSGREAIDAVEKDDWDLALVDLKMPGMDGVEVQRQLRERDPELTVIIMTGFGTVDTAVQALKQGAYDYLTKPIDPDELSHTVEKAIEHRRARRENMQLRECLEEIFPSTAMVGKSQAMKRVVELVEMVAPTPATVLITGESGTGKEIVARAIHASSPRRHMPMVVIHCGALTETLLESELFGHERGAFTGAQTRKKGKFEMADGGTVFLDEIADISLKTQTDLLRVLQEREIVRVGGGQTFKVDFRCIAATNKDLKGHGGGRLIPSRPVLSTECRLHRTAAAQAAQGRRAAAGRSLPTEVFAGDEPAGAGTRAGSADFLLSYDWPGNVRELENAVERALVIRRGNRIEASDFPFQVRQPTSNNGQSLEEVERAHVEHIVRETSGNLSHAARILHIDRTTLYNKLRRYGLR